MPERQINFLSRQKLAKHCRAGCLHRGKRHRRILQLPDECHRQRNLQQLYISKGFGFYQRAVIPDAETVVATPE